MTETITHIPHQEHHDHHSHHHHEHDSQADGVLALHAEDLYLRLADQARSSLMTGVVAPGIAESDEVRSTRERLGERAPELTKRQQQLVNGAFTTHYGELPKREEEHHHGHDHGGCGKRHGPLQRLIEKVEHKATSRVKHQRAKVAVGLLFRAGLFTMCPGDDIAAIGLQVYGSMAGSHQEDHKEHDHAEVYAILPRRPRLVVDLEAGRARVTLPLDNAVSHEQLPQTKAGAAVRELIDDYTEPDPVPKRRHPEKRRRRSRIAALGFMAVAAIGGLVSADAGEQPVKRETPQYAQAQTPVEKPLPTPVSPPQSRKQSPTETHQVARGESQWSIAQDQIIEAGLPVSSSKIQRVAQYIAGANKSTNKDPNYIQAGQSIEVPRKTLVLRLVTQ